MMRLLSQGIKKDTIGHENLPSFLCTCYCRYKYRCVTRGTKRSKVGAREGILCHGLERPLVGCGVLEHLGRTLWII